MLSFLFYLKESKNFILKPGSLLRPRAHSPWKRKTKKIGWNRVEVFHYRVWCFQRHHTIIIIWDPHPSARQIYHATTISPSTCLEPSTLQTSNDTLHNWPRKETHMEAKTVNSQNFPNFPTLPFQPAPPGNLKPITGSRSH